MPDSGGVLETAPDRWLRGQVHRLAKVKVVAEL